MPVEAPPAPAAPAPAPAAPAAAPTQIPVAPPLDHTRPRPGSARDKVFQGLQRVVTPDEKPPNKVDAPKPPDTQPDPTVKPNKVDAPVDEDDDLGITDPTVDPKLVKPTDPPVDPTKAGKTNPWKVVDQWKSKAATLEKELAEAKSASLVEAEKKSYLDRIQAAEARNQELEKEMHFVNYEKSTEFKTKYQEPYQKAWDAMQQELSELTVEDPDTGTHRAFTNDDMLKLLSLDLKPARELANQIYGDLADDVMAHRKEIRKLFQVRSNALKEARENGAEREKERQELEGKSQKEVSETVMRQWTKYNEEITKDEKYGTFFVPKEGDEQGNQRLAKGFELVDRAMRENPLDPKLSSEERSRIINRQAAVRNRAAAFSRMKLWIDGLTAEKTALEKELQQYKASEPATRGSETPTNPQPTSAREGVFSSLRNLAK